MNMLLSLNMFLEIKWIPSVLNYTLILHIAFILFWYNINMLSRGCKMNCLRQWAQQHIAQINSYFCHNRRERNSLVEMSGFKFEGKPIGSQATHFVENFHSSKGILWLSHEENDTHTTISTYPSILRTK